MTGTVPRVHHSQRPISALSATPPHDLPQRKPRGLWWAAPGAWAGLWNNSGGKLPEKSPGRHVYALRPGPGLRLCTLDSAQSVLAFTARYGIRPGPEIFQPASPKRERPDPTNPKLHVSVIAWNEVHAEYDGIEVTAAALSGSGRPRLDWLDLDWAIPSGCLWRPTAGTVLRPLNTQAASSADRLPDRPAQH